VDQQYALPDEVDIDIFSKKRAVKANDDHVVESQRASNASDRNLVTDNNPHLDHLNQSSTKKMLPRPKIVQDTTEVLAKIKAVKNSNKTKN